MNSRGNRIPSLRWNVGCLQAAPKSHNTPQSFAMELNMVVLATVKLLAGLD